MTFSIHGIGAGRGIAIGRALIIRSGWASVGQHFISPAHIAAELHALDQARAAVICDMQHSLASLGPDAPAELPALLEVHLLLLQDDDLFAAVRSWIADHHYNAAWALSAQYDCLERQFDDMDDPYLRARKADLEQVLGRIIQYIQGHPALVPDSQAQDEDTPGIILVAHDLGPADMQQWRHSSLCGFVTESGGQTSHTAIVARSMGIPAIVGARMASQRIHQDDTLIIDASSGTLIVNPSADTLADYTRQQQQQARDSQRLHHLLHTPSITRDGHRIELLANIEMPEDASAALAAGAVGVGLFRSEFLFMGRRSLPDEDEQYQAYTRALHGMKGLPVTIRTVDIGADKPLALPAGPGPGPGDAAHPNPALGQRAIRWSLSEPEMFLTQLRAILRTAAHGRVNLLIPMLAHSSEIHQSLQMLDTARQQLDARGAVYGDVLVGAMIEVPAAALMARSFLQYFDFLSIGTNDLIQYTLAIDRTDERVAHLYDPTHPAVLRLIAETLRAGQDMGKPVGICGEMAGDTRFTHLLLGLGLRYFSMHPAQILTVKQHIVQANVSQLSGWAQQVLHSDQPGLAMRTPPGVPEDAGHTR